ncbi:MAG: arylsulfatase, partial [Pseudomonadota bacterium]|nr:arylsulfatase [Pseudomonadota bacterium]
MHDDETPHSDSPHAASEAGTPKGMSRRKMLSASSMAAALPALGSLIGTQKALAQAASGRKPNILVIWGDDIGWQNVS